MAPIINEVYSGLEDVPWISLGDYPSSAEKLEKMGEHVDFPGLYIKRDDCCHNLYGGNKVRKLEYVLADAKEKNRNLLITLGAVGSNQVLATGIHGGSEGFEVMGIVMDQPNSDYVRKNLLLDAHFGIELVYTRNTLQELLMSGWKYAISSLRGRKPYYVPPGASSPIGNLGFVNAIFELRRQIYEGEIPEPDYIIAAAGSVGTVAGLELGCKLLGIKTRVIAVRVAMPWMVTTSRFARMVNNICKYMRSYDENIPEIRIDEEEIILLEDFLGKGYAHITEEGYKAVKDMMSLEGIPLDPTYTGKALSGGLKWLKNRGERKKQFYSGILSTLSTYRVLSKAWTTSIFHINFTNTMRPRPKKSYLRENSIVRFLPY